MSAVSERGELGSFSVYRCKDCRCDTVSERRLDPAISELAKNMIIWRGEQVSFKIRGKELPIMSKDANIRWTFFSNGRLLMTFPKEPSSARNLHETSRCIYRT